MPFHFMNLGESSVLLKDQRKIRRNFGFIHPDHTWHLTFYSYSSCIRLSKSNVLAHFTHIHVRLSAALKTRRKGTKHSYTAI